MIVNPKEVFKSYKEPIFAGVPDELKGYRQWVVWNLETTKENQEKGKKPTKVPYSPLTYRKTGNNDKYQETWGTFEEACTAFATGKFSGIMLNITAADPFVVIDFDHCIIDGEINDEIEKYIQSLDSYTEISPSGTGIHIIIRGKKPGPRCKRQWPDYEIEMYENGRFITITGHVVDNKHFVNQDQDALSELYHERLPENKPKFTNTVAPVPVTLDDNALLEKIRSSKQGAKFDALMAGNTSGYSTKGNEGHSEADLALCSILAWWSGKDAERIDRIFRSSGLIRAKWDEQRGHNGTYGQMTINEAIKGTEGQYTGGKQKSNVVPLRKNTARKVQTTETGFTDQPALFAEPYPWPDTGSLHYIDPVTGAVYRGHMGSDARDLIALRPIWIHSLANDEFGEAYRVIKFFDQDLKERIACFPAQWFSKSKDANLWASLMAQGMITMSGKEKYISRYLDLMSSHCTIRSWAASKLGWFEIDSDEVESNPVFVLPDQVIGQTGDSRDVFFQSTHDVNSKSISRKGTLKDWKYNIADKAKGNYLMMFVIAAGLAGGMTKLSGTSSGGFHFWGLSSCGKTTLLQLAASVWGNGSDPQTHSRKTSIRKWNSTVSGLEATAQLHNDIVLCLDEIGELDQPGDLSKLIYNLTGGTPRGRSTEIGGLRNQAYWHIMLLSSGEVSSEQILKSAGQSKKGGQTHRLPDIRIDGLKNGIVQTDEDNPKKFTNQLKKNCSRYFGTAGPVFVSSLLKEIEIKGHQEFVDEINSNIRLMEERLCNGVDPLPREIARVLERISAIAVAAMYAAEAGILDWCPVTIQECMVFVRDLWLSDMEEEISELDKALSELRSNLITNLANFEDLSDTTQKLPIKMMGYKNYDYIMILPKVMDDFCSGYSKRQLLKELEIKKLLSLGEFDKRTNRYKIAKKIPLRQSEGKHVKERPRCYWISRYFLDG